MRTLHFREVCVALTLVFSFSNLHCMLWIRSACCMHIPLDVSPAPSLKSSGSTLSHAVVSMVDDISEPRVCASCSFTNDSTARGCTVELQNGEFTFVFNMSRQSSGELTLLECFPVPEAGVFSVSVYEVDHDGMVEHRPWRLPDVTAQPDVDTTIRSVINGIHIISACYA